MTILPSNFRLPRDLQEPALVAGRGSDMEPVVITGGYTADFYGIEFQVTNLLSLLSISDTALVAISWPISPCLYNLYQGEKIVAWAKCCGGG